MKVHHQYQRILAANFTTGTAGYQTADILKWTWMKKFIYMLILLNKGVPKKIIKTFMIKDFFSFASGVNDTSDAPWAANISANFQKNSKRP